MEKVKITDLREHLPSFLSRVKAGEELTVTSRGKIIAKIVPPENTKETAKKKLKELRKKSRIGDVISPIKAHWDAQ